MNRIAIVVLAGLVLNACALPGRDPLQVTVADIESLPGEGMEVRMLVKLRVQNPNEAPIEYDGVFIKIDVLNRTLASGVSGERGVVPRYGESIISVPLTVSTLRVIFGALGVIGGSQSFEKVDYRMEGKLDGVGFGSTRFQAAGQLSLPVR